MGSASLGDVCGDQWWVYGFGVTDCHFDVPPFARGIRVLHRGHADAGRPCVDDPVGASRVAGIPNSIGRKETIRIEPNEGRMSRSPRCHMAETSVPRGASANRPLISHEMRIPFIHGKLVILGGRPGLVVENWFGHEAAEQMMHPY